MTSGFILMDPRKTGWKKQEHGLSYKKVIGTFFITIKSLVLVATSNDHVTFLIYLFGWFSSKSVRPSDLFNCRLLWRLYIKKKERKCHWGPLWKHTRKSGSKQHHSSVVATENSTSCVHSPDNESSFAWQEGPHKGFDTTIPSRHC